jgi:hypothetical protein
MSRMLDQIRSSQVPANMMQFAARGALSVPPEETVEILVYLALHNKLFGEQARLTLAGWDEKTSKAVAADPKTSPEVLNYLVSPDNLRISLVPALADNPSVEEEALDELASSGSRAVVECLLKSARVMNSQRLLEALQSNLQLRPNELAEIGNKLAGVVNTPVEEKVEESPAEESAETVETDAPDVEIQHTVTKYLEENAAELEAEKDKPFQAIGLSPEEVAASGESQASSLAVSDDPPVGDPPVDDPPAASSPSNAELVPQVEPEVEPEGAHSSASAGSGTVEGIQPKPAVGAAAKPGATAAAVKAKKAAAAAPDRRDSTLLKISKLDIRGRISLAMRGNKEDRSILIRDSTKLVAIAVLESPKITDGEVEKFALQKNVLESVLRAIPMKRRFAKNYNIIRNLVQNPRTPMDLALSLMKNLLARDLKNLSGNKEVADTIRKVALRMYRQKLEKKG